ncbi:MAG: hypothetical protein GY852_07420 [bacterium]|nr:hypothetical protein [bacterium]
METKQIAAVVLILIALGVGYYVLTLPPEPAPNGGEVIVPGEYLPPFATEGENVTLQEFASNLLTSSKLYIVEDLRSLELYPLSKQNIMQCGTDYAGSPGLVGKEFNVYAFDDGDLCYTLNGSTSISECYEELLTASEDPDTAIIWIEKGFESEVYLRGMVVRLSDSYVQGTCKTSVLVPIPEEEANETGLPEFNLSEMEGPGPVIINDTFNDSSENETTEEGPGDSHTFP